MNLVLKFLIEAVRKNPGYFLKSISLTILCACLASSAPWLLQHTLEAYAQKSSDQMVLSSCLLILIPSASIILEIVWNQSLDRFGGKFIKDLLTQCQQVLMRADGYDVMKYPEDTLSFRLYSNVLDVFRTIGHHIPQLIGSLILVLTLLMVSLRENPSLGIFLAIAFLAGTGISYFSHKAIQFFNEETNRSLSCLHGHIVNFTESLDYYKANLLEKEITDQTARDVDAFIQASIREDRHVYFYSGIVKQSNTLISVFFSFLLAYQLEQGITLNAAVYTLLFNLVMRQAENAEQLLMAISRTLISFRNTDELLKLPQHSGTLAIRKINCLDIDLSGFSYPDHTQRILESFHARFARGSCIHLMGRNGSGKSTLFRLLTKTIECYDGKILVDGISLSEIETDSYLNRIAYISQSEPLLNLPVKEYLRKVTHQPLADDEIDQILDRLHFGDSEVCIQNGGTNLSGGQIKKLLLAKLMIMEPLADCIFLDEIDSELDLETRALYEELLNEIAAEKNRIICVIQHYPDSRIHFDAVVQL